MKNCKPGENIFQSAPQKENATRFLFFCTMLVFPSSNKSQFCASNKIEQNQTISKSLDEILDQKEEDSHRIDFFCWNWFRVKDET